MFADQKTIQYSKMERKYQNVSHRSICQLLFISNLHYHQLKKYVEQKSRLLLRRLKNMKVFYWQLKTDRKPLHIGVMNVFLFENKQLQKKKEKKTSASLSSFAYKAKDSASPKWECSALKHHIIHMKVANAMFFVDYLNYDSLLKISRTISP